MEQVLHPRDLLSFLGAWSLQQCIETRSSEPNKKKNKTSDPARHHWKYGAVLYSKRRQGLVQPHATPPPSASGSWMIPINRHCIRINCSYRTVRHHLHPDHRPQTNPLSNNHELSLRRLVFIRAARATERVQVCPQQNRPLSRNRLPRACGEKLQRQLQLQLQVQVQVPSPRAGRGGVEGRGCWISSLSGDDRRGTSLLACAHGRRLQMRADRELSCDEREGSDLYRGGRKYVERWDGRRYSTWYGGMYDHY